MQPRLHSSAADEAAAFPLDPRSLALPERQAWRHRLAAAHTNWRARLLPLLESQHLADDFPAFLLATPPLQPLAARLQGAARRADLPTEVLDELDHFVRAYAAYLRTRAGEDVFGSDSRRAG